jgi:hypothetical protein
MSIYDARPITYDPDLIWGYNPNATPPKFEWFDSSDMRNKGGGKCQNSLVAIGQDENNKGTIYYQLIADEVIEEISYPIIGSDWNGESASTLYISGNHASEFANQSYTITNSTNDNNGTYDSGFDGVFYNSGQSRTEIAVNPVLTNEPINGSLTVI